MDEVFNAEVWLVERHLQSGRANHVALVGTETVTYGQLAALVADVTAGLRGLGLGRDDRIVFVTNDDIPMASGILAAFRAGFVAVPVSTMLGGDELGEIIVDCGATVVVASAEYADAVRIAVKTAPDVRRLILEEPVDIEVPERIAVSLWDELIEAGAKAPDSDKAVAPTTEDSWALWLYTSGTTGRPKGAMHTHVNIRHVCGTYADQVLGIGEDDICFSIAKLFFAYGIGNTLFFPLSVGATSCLDPRRPAPHVVAERITADRPTLFFAVPTFYAALLGSDLPAQTFDSVRMGISAGEPLPAALQERFADRFGIEILDGIGSTEALHIYLSNRPGEIRPGTTGLAVPGYDIELRDADGAIMADGVAGSLFVRGDSIALGYWSRPDATRMVFTGGWLNTGDTYVRSQDGFYTCLGRSSDLLKAGGIWVSPTEVEARLLQHPAVAEVVVVGVSDADGLDKPIACVVAAGEVDADELIQWCREGLAAFKRPRNIVFIEALPKTATGKIQRFKIRELMQQLDVAPPAASGR